MSFQVDLLKLRDSISRISASVKSSNNAGHTDINHICENALCEILKRIYKWEGLVNLNTTSGRNYPAIDLADTNSGLAVQVTSTATIKKIKDTLEKFFRHELQDHYQTLKIFVLTEKQKTYAQNSLDTIIDNRISFDVKEDIIDFSDLYKKATESSPDDVKESVLILDSYFNLNSLTEEMGWTIGSATNASIDALDVAFNVNREEGVTSHIRFSEQDIYVNRKKQEEILVNEMQARTEKDEKGRWLSVSGDAGKGKSSLLWFLTDQPSFKKKGICLAAQILGDQSYKLLENETHASKIIIIDTLDLLIAHNSERTSSLIAKLKNSGNLIITTCRTNELREIQIVPNRSVPLDSYDNEQCKQAIRNYIATSYPELPANNAEIQFDAVWNLLDGRRNLRELTFDPLILSMIYTAYVPDSIPKDINTQRVYDDFLTNRILRDHSVENRHQGRKRQNLCLEIAQKIVFDRASEAIDSIGIENLSEAGSDEFETTLHSLVSSGVLNYGIGETTVRFFHQTFLEYMAAKFVLQSHKQEYIAELLSDVETQNMFRVPVLKQLTIQYDQASETRDFVMNILHKLKVNDTDLAFQIALEICGKIVTNESILRLMQIWIEEDPVRRAQSVRVLVANYSVEKFAFACGLLKPCLDVKEYRHSIFELLRYMATLDPNTVANFTKYAVALSKRGDNSDDSFLREILVEVVVQGEYSALDTLQSFVKDVNDSAKARVFEGLCRAEDSSPLAKFCLDTLHMAFQSEEPSTAAAWAALCCRLNSDHIEVQNIINILLNNRDVWRRNKRHANSAGRVIKRYLNKKITIELCSELTNVEGHERIFIMKALMGHSGVLAENILSSIQEVPDKDNMLTKIKWKIASTLLPDSPNSRWHFVKTSTWPKDSADTTVFSDMFENLARSDSSNTISWLHIRLQSEQDTKVTGKLLFSIYGAISAAVECLDRDFADLIWVKANQAGTKAIAGFAQSLSLLATRQQELSHYYASLVLDSESATVTAAFVRGMRNAVGLDGEFILYYWDTIYLQSIKLGKPGLWYSYLDVLKHIDAQNKDKLVAQFISHYSSSNIQKVTDNEILKVLEFVKVFGESYACEFLPLVHSCWRPDQAIAGAQSACYQNMVHIVVDRKFLEIIFEDIQRTIRVSGSQRRLRHALRKIMPKMIDEFGVHYVTEKVAELFPQIKDQAAQQDVIKALIVSSSWSKTDSQKFMSMVKLPQSVRNVFTSSAL